ncbi:hypothetical protein PsYK624_058720 [Phanerochaete sordida]|uniref:Uncharacterized protein n=1 Tax=Phanerochaete sordida TaxID=48140 RepID=A0A9P3G8D0_9APHY|nr:hypothetical protein PsYK624_058720 [Phanerochaete sordida]
MECSSSAVTYAEQLASRGYGLPLWHPEPQAGAFGHAEIGDVGFLSEGRFFRLFNALHSASHPINAYGVPAGFMKLEPNKELLKDDPRAVDPRPICTTSTVYRRAGVGAGVSLNLAGVEASYSFSSSVDRGAIAVLGDYGHQRWYLSNRQFRDYIVAHHASWYAFADDNGYLLSPDAIILVSGWLKTSEWAIATFANFDRSQQIDLHASVGSYASAVFRAANHSVTHMSVEQRSGPQTRLAGHESALPRDQCLFLRYYKLKTRTFGRPKVLLRADAKDIQPLPESIASPQRSYRASDSASSTKTQHSRLRSRLRWPI